MEHSLEGEVDDEVVVKPWSLGSRQKQEGHS